MRQTPPRPIETPARGLLHEKTSFEHFELHRFAPSPELVDWVEHHWMVLHDLGERPPFRQRNLSHPNQHVVIEPGGVTGIFGAATGVFEHTIVGTGRVFATKFLPGAFRPFFGRSVSAVTDTSLPVEAAFARTSEELAREFAGLNDPTGMAEQMEAMFLAALPEPDEKSGLTRRIVGFAEANLEVVSVAALAETFDMSVRALQRLFDEYVGVSPKWVIDRYRMLEAVTELNAGAESGLTGEAPGRFVHRPG